jgi:GNAT superfamily N-acetyltransferase
MNDSRRLVPVRPRSQRDGEGCIELLRAVYAADEYPTIWPKHPGRWLTPSRFLAAWVALNGSTVVAHIALVGIAEPADECLVAASGRPASQMAEIARLFIHPDSRGGGLAERLLDTASSYAKGRGLLPVIEVNERRARAIRVYERTGWRRVGTGPADWVNPSGERPLLHYFLRPDEKQF